MEEMLQELEKSPALLDFLRGRKPSGPDGTGCAPSCSWILEDLETNGKLTGHPKDSVGLALYPVPSKIAHLYLELVGGPLPRKIVPALQAILEKVRTMKVEKKEEEKTR